MRIRSDLSKALAGVALAWMAAAPAQALTVFACEPEWAALTRILAPQARVHVSPRIITVAVR